MLERAICEWSEGLAGLDGEQIKAAITAVREQCQFPPTIAEFRKLATASQSMHPSHAALPPPEPIDENGRKRLQDAIMASTIGLVAPSGTVSNRAAPKRVLGDIESGAWTMEHEIRYLMHAATLGHLGSVGNPLGLDVAAIPRYPFGVDRAEVDRLVSAIADQFRAHAAAA